MLRVLALKLDKEQKGVDLLEDIELSTEQKQITRKIKHDFRVWKKRATSASSPDLEEVKVPPAKYEKVNKIKKKFIPSS